MSDATVRRPWLSEWRAVFYIFCVLWILLQPVFISESAHFGWGMFAWAASILLVPAILAALVGDFVMCLVNGFTGKAESLTARLVRPLIPALLLAGSLYWLSTRPHVFSDYIG